MVEVTKTYETKYTVYQAYDGVCFKSSEECIKYEQSAASAIMQELVPIATDLYNSWLDTCDENIYKTICPRDSNDIFRLNQLFSLKVSQSGTFDKSDIGRPILIGYRFYENGFDAIWFYRLDEIIKQITNNNFVLMLKQ